QQIKHEVGKAVSVLAIERVLERIEVRDAGIAHDDDLAIEPGILDCERGKLLAQARHLRRPVVSVACVEANAPALDTREDAVPVQLDFVCPSGAGRRCAHQRGELWSDAVRDHARSPAATRSSLGPTRERYRGTGTQRPPSARNAAAGHSTGRSAVERAEPGTARRPSIWGRARGLMRSSSGKG